MSLVGTTHAISSINWFSAWIGLELNLLSFTPLIINNKNSLSTEAAIIYFLIQSSASSIFIFFCIYNSYYSFIYFFFNLNSINLIIIPLLIKLGAAPFHNWFILVIKNLTWFLCYLLITLQKIAPLFILNLINIRPNIILSFALISLVVGSVGGLNQTSLNKILAFSSVNHLGWMLTANILNKSLLIIYLIFYIFINLFVVQFLNIKNITHFNQLNFLDSLSWALSILSLGGLPPLVGFLPKLIIIKLLIINNFYFITTIIVLTALITLVFYLRLIIFSLIFTSHVQKWIVYVYYSNNITKILFIVLSSLGLLLFNFILT